MTKERIEIVRQSLIPFVRKELLEINFEGLGKFDADEFEKDLNEILNLAIKALEQQPSDDCVSRAELLKKYEDRFIELQKVHQQDKQLGVNWCINTLKDMPPVTPTFPKGATNGDMIKAMFPDIKIHEHEKTDICDAYIQIDIWDFSTYVSKDWWDAPYKRGDSDGSN